MVANNLVVAFLVVLSVMVIGSIVIIPLPVIMLAMSASIVYIGSHLSVKISKPTETMSANDAYMFPFIGSAVLFSLYILFKYFSKEYVNMLLSIYFFGIGVFAISESIDPLTSQLFSKNKRENLVINTQLKILTKGPLDIQATIVDCLNLAISSIFTLWYTYTRNWVASNILGVAFSILGIRHLNLGSYKVGAILLCGLFVYDIFWVFGTEVMVTVAKSFDAPIKLLFPRAFATETDPIQFSMLGLGDIVIPGVFIALLLRFDYERAGKPDNMSYSKPYFHVCFISYNVGLLVTIGVMYVFQAAQPALLYLVPACLGSSLLQALICGEIKVLFDYEEKQDDDKNEHSEASQNQMQTKKHD